MKQESARTTRDEFEENGKTALVLGGGGARGYAHLGVAQVLRSAGIEPDLVVGTSMGAVIGAAVANEANLEGMIKVLKRLDVNKILKISRESRRELEKAIGKSLVREMGVRKRRKGETDKPPVKLARLFTFFKLMTKNSRIEDLPLQYAAVATELDRGKEVVIRTGKVYRAAAASAAIPGFIPPVKLDGQSLIDGGVVDTLPVLPALNMGAKRILAIDVSENLKRDPDNSPLALFYRTSKIRQLELTKTKNSIAKEKLGDRLQIMELPVGEINWLDFNRVEEAASIGREFARKEISLINDLFNDSKK